jgi:hypothetical protein
MLRRRGSEVEFLIDWQIGDALLRLITESKERLTLVSPYNKHWGHLKREVAAAKRRGVSVRIYYRADESNPAGDYNDIDAIPVRMLHAKIYANEAAALVTTMNLVEASATHSREVGFLIRDSRLLGQVDSYVATFADGSETEAPPAFGNTNRNGSESAQYRVESANDIAKIIDGFGFCIECGNPITFDPGRPLCPSCYSRFGRNGVHGHCHKCGEDHSTQINQPLCSACAPASLTTT